MVKRLKKNNKVTKVNWYELDHAKVSEIYGGQTYCADICVNGEYTPSAIYRATKPDRSKGHKDYILITIEHGKGFIRGMDKDEISKWAEQDCLECIHCRDIIYSVNRHDFRFCKCGKCSIDGGKDYTKVSGNPGDYVIKKYNLLED